MIPLYTALFTGSGKLNKNVVVDLKNMHYVLQKLAKNKNPKEKCSEKCNKCVLLSNKKTHLSHCKNFLLFHFLAKNCSLSPKFANLNIHNKHLIFRVVLAYTFLYPLHKMKHDILLLPKYKSKFSTNKTAR